MTIITGYVILAVLLERLTEFLTSVWFQWPKDSADRPKVIQSLVLLVGMAVCVVGRLDMLAILGLKLGFVGSLLTGFVLAMGVDFVHKIWDIARNLAAKYK